MPPTLADELSDADSPLNLVMQACQSAQGVSFNGLHPCWKEIEGNEAKLKTQHELQRGVGGIH